MTLTRPFPALPYCKRQKAGWGLGTRLDVCCNAVQAIVNSVANVTNRDNTDCPVDFDSLAPPPPPSQPADEPGYPST